MLIGFHVESPLIIVADVLAEFQSITMFDVECMEFKEEEFSSTIFRLICLF